MNNYVVIDIETSGINPDKDEIIRLSALSIVNGNEAGTFFKLAKPIKPLTEEIEILTGITNVDLKEKCGINDLLPDFYRSLLDRFDVDTVVSDYISGMTDRYAVYTFEEIYVPKNFLLR